MNTKKRTKRNAFLGAGRAGFGSLSAAHFAPFRPTMITPRSGFQRLDDCPLGGGQRIRIAVFREVGKRVVLPLQKRHSVEQFVELRGLQGRANARESSRDLTARVSKSFALSAIM
jgi:hypothetical protein